MYLEDLKEEVTARIHIGSNKRKGRGRNEQVSNSVCLYIIIIIMIPRAESL